MTTAQPGQEQRMVTDAMIEDCDVIVERHDTPRPLPVIDPISGVIWSDERIRVWHIFDIGHTPEKGKHLVRVDIFAAPATRPTADLGELEPDGTGIDTSPSSGNSPEEQRADVGGTLPRNAADLGDDGELVDWLDKVRTGTHGDITLHSGMAAIRLGKARDRLILYREALERFCEIIARAERDGFTPEIEQELIDLRAVLSRSGG